MRLYVVLLTLSACSRVTEDYQTCKGSCASILVSPASPVVTAGKTLQLAAQVAGNASEAVSFRVLDAQGGTITAAGSYTAPATPGTYHVAASAADASGTVSIVVAPVPVSPALSAGRAAVTADGGPYTATVAAPVDGLTYLWSVSGGALQTSPSGTSVSFTVAHSGVLLLTAQVTNAAGDSAAPGELPLNIVPPLSPPVLDVPATVTEARSDLVALVGNPQEGATYAWQQTASGVTTAIAGNGASVKFTSGAHGDTLTVAVQETTAAGDVSDWVTSAPIAIVSPGVSVIAGVPGGIGDIDGQGAVARFWFQSIAVDGAVNSGITADSNGNLYVGDTANHTIRQISAGGNVTLLTGIYRLPNFGDGPPGQDPNHDASFIAPGALAIIGSHLYVSDYFDDGSDTYCLIRDVSLATATLGTTTTVYNWSCDYPVAAMVRGASDSELFIATGTTISKINPASWPQSQRFAAWNKPSAVNFNYTALVYDTSHTTLLAAGGDSFSGDSELDRYDATCAGTCAATAVTSTFNAAYGPATSLAIDAGHNVFVGFAYGISYLAHTAGGYATPLVDVAGGLTVAPTHPQYVWPSDGTGTTAFFAGVTSLVSQGSTLFAVDVDTLLDTDIGIDDSNISTIRQITNAGASPNSGVVSTYAGAPRLWGNADAPNGFVAGVSPARFANVVAAAIDGADHIFVGDCNASNAAPTRNSKIREVGFDGVVQSIAGDGLGGVRNGVGAAAELQCPRGLSFAPSGDLIFADVRAHTISGMKPNHLIYPIAGQPGSPGYTDGVGTSAAFAAPIDLKVDAAGNIFVADFDNCAIREIFPNGTVTTYVDLAVSNQISFAGDANADPDDLCPTLGGAVANKVSLAPIGIAALGDDWLVAVADNNALIAVVERVSLKDGAVAVTPLVGCQSPLNSTDPRASGTVGSCHNDPQTTQTTFEAVFDNANVHTPCLQANLRTPTQLLVAPDGSVFIADGQVLQRVTGIGTDACEVNTIVGSSNLGVKIGPLAQANLSLARGLALTRSGDVIVVDENEGVVLLVRYN